MSTKLLVAPVDCMILIIILGGILAAVVSWIEFKKKGGPGRGTATALLVTSLLLITTNILEKLFEIQERKRRPDPIERIRALVDVEVESNRRELARLGERLEGSAADCLLQAAGLPERDETYFVEQSCLPDANVEPFASSALGFLVIEIQIYKSGEIDSESEERKPDLAGLFAAAVSDETLQVAYDREAQVFILHVPSLEHAIADLDPSGEITTSDDMAGARLLVSLENFNLDTHAASDLYSAMQLERLELRLAGSRTRYVVPGRDQLIEERRDTNPVYLYSLGEAGAEP